MIGSIAGDIIGSVYEHNPIKTTEFPLFQDSCCFTDDSVLTVALASSILFDIPYKNELEKFYYKYPNAGYGGNFLTEELMEITDQFNQAFNCEF